MRVTADTTGTIIAVEGEGLGYSSDDLIGQNIIMLVPDELKAAHEAGFGRWAAGGGKKVMGTWLELPACTAAGDTATMSVVLTEKVTDDASTVTAIID
jgi:PAS domain S-box-containing protein